MEIFLLVFGLFVWTWLTGFFTGRGWEQYKQQTAAQDEARQNKIKDLFGTKYGDRY